MQHDTGLQRRESSAITTEAEYEQRVRQWQEQHAHILSPAVSFCGLPPQHVLMASMVKLSPDPSPNGPGDVYQDNVFTKGQEVAISKIGLSKIAQCAGISIETQRTDTRTVANYWEVKATAKWIGFDGTPQSCQASVEYDLRDGSPRLKGFGQAQIDQARKFGLAGAETRAINRAIRQFGVKGKYFKADLEKPFAVLRVRFEPDMNDPVQRAIVTQQRLQGTSMLYPSASPLPALPPTDAIDGHVIPSSAGSSSSAPATVSSSTSSGAEGLPNGHAETAKSEPTFTITKVLKSRQEDGSFRFFVQTAETLDSMIEAEESVAMAAKAAKDAGRAVHLDLERTASGQRIAEIRTASTTLPNTTEL